MRAFLRLSFLLLPFPALADISVHQLLSDGAVLQRGVSINLPGKAENEKVVKISLDGTSVGEASVRDGKWQFTLKPQQAGGPHTLTFSGDNVIALKDVYFGDVWLASGQSNMELTMARVEEAYPQDVTTANFPLIREFTVPDEYEFKAPRDDYADGQWRAASSENIRDLSAVAYYFARQLHKEQQVPIGIINASLGGSPIESWMSEAALEQFPEALTEGKRYADDKLVKETLLADKQREQQWYSDLAQADPGLQSTPPWYSAKLNDSDWKTITMPAMLEGSENDGFAGVWWLRKAVTLDSAPQQDVNLRLGTIVDADEVYVNGTKVGNTTYQYPPRQYSIPAKLLQAGKNTLAVRVTSTGGRTGFISDKPYFMEAGQERKLLSGEWKYKVAQIAEPLAPPTFIRWKPLGLYNAMVAPALGFPIKGAIWYQGESNTKAPQGYADKLTAMIQDWRKKWRSGPFPFLIVELANFMPRSDTPEDTAWAQLRHEQQQAAKLENTSTVTTIDIGEWNDIHPVNKKAVGERLARAAQHLAYNQKVDYQGPVLTGMVTQGEQLVLTFDENPVLKTNGHNGFAIAGEDESYKWAEVRLDERKIILSHPQISRPIFVRYAWGNNPVAGVYDTQGLPAAPFAAKLNSKKP